MASSVCWKFSEQRFQLLPYSRQLPGFLGSQGCCDDKNWQHWLFQHFCIKIWMYVLQFNSAFPVSLLFHEEWGVIQVWQSPDLPKPIIFFAMLSNQWVWWEFNRSQKTLKCGMNVRNILGCCAVCHFFVLITFWHHLIYFWTAAQQYRIY